MAQQLQCQWYNRLQFNARRILKARGTRPSETAEGEANSKIGVDTAKAMLEREDEFIDELKAFVDEARRQAGLLAHALPSKDAMIKNNFFQVAPHAHPVIWKVYSPKFNNDRVFVREGLVFTVVEGDEANGISPEEAFKIYGNEVKGMQALCDGIFCLGFESLMALPISCLVDYICKRILVEPMMPLTGAEPMDMILYLHHRICQSRDPNSNLDDCTHPAEFENTLGTFGSVGHNDDQSRQDNIIQASFQALDQVDKQFSEQLVFISKRLKLENWPINFGTTDFKDMRASPRVRLFRHRSDRLIVMRGFEEVLPPKIKRDGSVMNPKVRLRQEYMENCSVSLLSTTNSMQLLQIMHEHNDNKNADNMPSNDILQSTIGNDVHISDYDKLCNCGEEIEGKIKFDLLPLIKDFNKNFFDTFDISNGLHSLGINMRYLGKLLQVPNAPTIFTEMVIVEIIARCAKYLYREYVNACIRISSTEETYHRCVVTFFNIILGNTDSSEDFWNSRLLPEAIKRYNVDLFQVTSVNTIDIYALFRALQIHCGVKFNSQYEQKNKIHVNIEDLSGFSNKDQMLFPQARYIQQSLIGSGTHFSAALRGQSLAAGTRIVRGFYPRVRLVFPQTLSCLEGSKRILRQYAGRVQYSLREVLPLLKAGLYTHTDEVAYFDCANIGSLGLLGPVRSGLCGLAFPCQPDCDFSETSRRHFEQGGSGGSGDKQTNLYASIKNKKLIDQNFVEKTEHEEEVSQGDENIEPSENDDASANMSEVFDAMINDNAEEQEEEQVASTKEKFKVNDKLKKMEEFKNSWDQRLKHCRNYHKLAVALEKYTYVYLKLNSDPLKTSKLLLHLAYIHFQHGQIHKAKSVAQKIIKHHPSMATVASEALAILVQFALRKHELGTAEELFSHFVNPSEYIEGKASVRMLFLHLSFGAYFYNHKMFERSIEACKKASSITKTYIDPCNCHWTGVAATHLIAKSYIDTNRDRKASILLESAIRVGNTTSHISPHVLSMLRIMLAEALERLGGCEMAYGHALRSLHELESLAGPDHDLTLNALYLTAKVRMQLGCHQVKNPPLSISEFSTQDQDRNILPVDQQIIESVASDPATKAHRAGALEQFSILFQRLMNREKYSDIVLNASTRFSPEMREHRNSSNRKRLFAVIKFIFSVQTCHLSIQTQRDFVAKLHCILLRESSFEAYEAKYCAPAKGETAQAERKKVVKIYGTRRIIPSPEPTSATFVLNGFHNLPSRDHDWAAMEELLFSKPSQSIVDICKECLNACLSQKNILPENWFDIIARKAVGCEEEPQAVQYFLNILKLLFSPLQKRAFISFLYASVQSPQTSLKTFNMRYN